MCHRGPMVPFWNSSSKTVLNTVWNPALRFQGSHTAPEFVEAGLLMSLDRKESFFPVAHVDKLNG